MNSHELGKFGEEICATYLKSVGYEILDKNFKCKQGEIDIIAIDKKEFVFIEVQDEYVFVEVKTRRNLKYGLACEAVTSSKQKHMLDATNFYLYLHRLENKMIRFDVIEVYSVKNIFYINHIKNVSII